MLKLPNFVKGVWGVEKKPLSFPYKISLVLIGLGFRDKCIVIIKMKIKIKFETEKYICTKNKTLDKFIKKWGTCCPM